MGLIKSKKGGFGNTKLAVMQEHFSPYNAIESVPTADALLAPRFASKMSNSIVYVEETVTVKGKAIRYNVSAK
jgi:hypothetical protein